MELNKIYSPADIEDKWYSYWTERGYFHSVPDERPAYSIVIPPPNVTGVLHMGHMLNNTIQDILIRRARLKGFNACWVPGTDHASIATEAKVVNLLKEQYGKTKWEVGREEFMTHAYAWKDKYGGIILDQLKKLGASCDWDRTQFTMDPKLSEAVIKVFVELHKKGLIYRGVRMTNWDPAAKTAVSDEEVNYKEVNSKLYYIRYQVSGSTEDFVTIATTRPETLLGDTAVCVHPEDERYAHLKGAKVVIPIVNREVPIIFDDYVDPEFGTGALKVTPAHDINDFMLGERHQLEFIDIFNEDGTISEAGGHYIGKDRFAVRKQIAKDLEEQGFLAKIEDIRNKVGYSERTDAVIEPRLTRQWFLKMESLATPALKHVMEDDIKFFPERFKNLYRHWLENIKDWCISRQLWWGQQIPAYYLPDGSYVVAETREAAFEIAKAKNPDILPEQLTQEEDVVDTWFSSWLWPISVFNGFENKEELNYYYPTSVLVTGWDIIFFWVARMIMAGYEFEGEKPFNHVYFTGMVRDKQGRKMSKSLGNSPDALKLIADFGADGVRAGIMLSAAAGNDLLFDEKLCEQGRNFCNKIWNALRLVKGWEIQTGANEELTLVFDWLENKLQKTIAEIDALTEEYRLSEALMTLYTFIWDDFCSWYLELIKPAFGEKIHQDTLDRTFDFFEKLIQLLHPYMPFITEEIWHALKERSTGEDLIVSTYPVAKSYHLQAIQAGELLTQCITAIRNARAKAQLSPKEAAIVYVETKELLSVFQGFETIFKTKANISELKYTAPEATANLMTELVGNDKLYIDLGITMDTEAEKKKLLEEIAYYEGFIKSVDNKLSNERFVQNAKPEVVDKERQKRDDGLAKLKSLQESLSRL